MQSSSQIVTINQHPCFSMLEAFPLTQFSVKALNGESITFHAIEHNKLICGSSILVLTIKG